MQNHSSVNGFFSISCLFIPFCGFCHPPPDLPTSASRKSAQSRMIRPAHSGAGFDGETVRGSIVPARFWDLNCWPGLGILRILGMLGHSYA